MFWLAPFWACLGCTAANPGLRIWKQAEALEQVTHYSFDLELPGKQWFTRVVEPGELPRKCVHRLSDRFDLLVIRTPQQWASILKATNLRRDLQPPPFSEGTVVGLIAHVGEPSSAGWPAVIKTVKRRGSVALLIAVFDVGYYRPLLVPPYLHLAFVPSAKQFLGLKLNHLLYGFNVDIADLNALGIH